VVAAARARQIRNPAGWARTALTDHWVDLTIPAASGEPPLATAELRHDPSPAVARPTAKRLAAMLDEVLDDHQMIAAIRLVTAGLAARAATSPPVVRARLLAWVQDLHRRDPHRPIEVLITRVLEAHAQQGDPERGKDTPSAADGSSTARAAFAARVRALLKPQETYPVPQ
jgi:hypothetical protein